MITLGLTGSIGTGKSTTTQLFRNFGIPVYDADKAVHSLYDNAAHTPIAEAFPKAMNNGKLDRAKLKFLIAQDATVLSQLENIVHPLVQEIEKKARIKASQQGHRIMVLDIPLLFETGGAKRCDVILVTYVDEAEQKRRVLARSGMSEAEFYRLLARQMPQKEKKLRAHIRLDTGLSIEKAKREVETIIRSLNGVIRSNKSYRGGHYA